MQDYEKLEAWQKAHALAVDVYKASIRMSRLHASLASQLRRAALSVPANISEGCGHDSQKELARFLGHSCASSNEVENHLRVARDVGAMHPALCADLRSRLREVRRMIVSLRTSVRASIEDGM